MFPLKTFSEIQPNAFSVSFPVFSENENRKRKRFLKPNSPLVSDFIYFIIIGGVSVVYVSIFGLHAWIVVSCSSLILLWLPVTLGPIHCFRRHLGGAHQLEGRVQRV